MTAAIDKFISEVTQQLLEAGFGVKKLEGGGVSVFLGNNHLCEVHTPAGVSCRRSDLKNQELEMAKDRVYELVRTTAEYVSAMQMAPTLQDARGTHELVVLSDYGGTMLAAIEAFDGLNFITCEWNYLMNTEVNVRYFGRNYVKAKRHFQYLSGFVETFPFFTPQQLKTIAICCKDVSQSWAEMSDEAEACIETIVDLICYGIPDAAWQDASEDQFGSPAVCEQECEPLEEGVYENS